jgi:hypothetical protein
MKTNRTTPNNKVDIIIRGDEKGTCLLVDTVISGPRSVTKTEAEKILKYKDLITGTAYLELKRKVVPVTIRQLEPSPNHSVNIRATIEI